MKKRTTILAWALGLFCIFMATAQLFGWLRLRDSTSSADLLMSFFLGFCIPLVFSITGAAIIARQPGNRVGWLLMLPALAAAYFGTAALLFAEPVTELTPVSWLLLWLENWSWIGIFFPILLIPLHFPSGRPPSPRWRWVNWLAAGMWVFFMLLVAFGDPMSPITHDWTVSNPIGFITEDPFEGPVMIIWSLGLLAIALGSVTSLIVRYRRAGIVEKEQIKWLLYAAALFGLTYGITVIVSFDGSGPSNILLDGLFLISILTLPVAIAISILRHRLFDIDVIIRKTAVYGVLTILLGLVYFGTVVMLQTIFGSLTGQQSPLILVISTLLMALLFSPLRRWVQGVIDRRFFRQKYDAQQVLENFAQTARNETDLNQLTGELVVVLQETLQPQLITLWIPEHGKAVE